MFPFAVLNRGVGAVAFHYVIKNVEYVARGVQTRECNMWRVRRSVLTVWANILNKPLQILFLFLRCVSTRRSEPFAHITD